MRTKPVIAMDLSSNGKGGGPYTSTMNILRSPLREKYQFETFTYHTELRDPFRVRRIADLVHQLKAIRPDIVHFTGMQAQGLFVAVACKLAGVPHTVVTARGFAGDDMTIGRIQRSIFNRLVEPLTMRLVDKAYGVSRYAASRELFLRFPQKSEGFVYNFPPLPYDRSLNPLPVREELGLPAGQLLIATSGRITRDKGYAVLTRAIREFFSHSPDAPVSFVVIGRGDYGDEMRRELADEVQRQAVLLLGYREDVSRILSESDLFVLPTLHETLSNSLLEASVEGLPLIASDTGGVPEIIQDGYNGLLVPPGDVDTLVQAMQTLVEDAPLRRQMGRHAKERVDRQFHAGDIVQKLDGIYTRLLASS